MPFYLKHMPKSIEQLQVTTLVFNFYFELSHLTLEIKLWFGLVLEFEIWRLRVITDIISW